MTEIPCSGRPSNDILSLMTTPFSDSMIKWLGMLSTGYFTTLTLGGLGSFRKLLFQPFRNPGTDDIASLIPFVRDARVRYRNRDETNSKCIDLGAVLNSFSYTKQTDPRDKVYAALGLVHPSSLCAEIMPDYNKSTEDVFRERSLFVDGHLVDNGGHNLLLQRWPWGVRTC